MKIYIAVILLYIANSQCGLVDILGPKSIEDDKKVVSDVVKTLNDGTKVLVDALGNIIIPDSIKNKEDGKTPDRVTTEKPKVPENDKVYDEKKPEVPKPTSAPEVAEKPKPDDVKTPEATTPKATEKPVEETKVEKKDA